MYRIKTNHNTMFGFYSNKQKAIEARNRLAKEGDSIGMKWPKSETKIVECQEDNSDQGWSDV